jgi:glycosyltransferase involved in cell wall biosynthesis
MVMGSPGQRHIQHQLFFVQWRSEPNFGNSGTAICGSRRAGNDGRSLAFSASSAASVNNSIRGRMKVLHLSASDIGGGAARSAYRLHLGLRRLGIDSQMLVLNKVSGDSAVGLFPVDRGLPARVARKLWRMRQGAFAASHRPLGDRSPEIFSIDKSPLGASILKTLPAADVLNLHWVAGMFDFDVLTEFCRRTPVVWTLHDMNPLTGGCHFDEACGRFQSACGQCPQLESSNPADISAQVLRRKVATTATIPENRLTFVAPSVWLTKQAQLSAPFRRFRCQTIPYGLDTDVFQPRNPMVVRELLGISSSARMILFLAEGLDNRRKGFDLLVRALHRLGDLSNTYVLAVGGEMPGVDLDLPLSIRVIPTVNDDRFLSFIYSAADVFVMASRADNLPNTVLESICCGTPVAGFNVGGVPDLVIPGETGELASAGDPESLAAAVRRLLSDEWPREQMRERCHQPAVAHYELQQQANRYRELYNRMLRRRARNHDVIGSRHL